MIAHHDVWLAVIALLVGAGGLLVEILQHRYAAKLERSRQ